MIGNVPATANGLCLYRIDHKDELIGCESVMFVEAAPAVECVLRRAGVSGRVEVDGDVNDHFADILDADGDIIATVALDSRSYGALKNRWMRCRVWRDDVFHSKGNSRG